MLYALFLIFCFVILITAKCPPGSIPSFSDKNLCLHFNATKTYYLEAEQACKDMGGHLTSVHNLVDNMYLSQEASSNKFTEDDFWFGANDLYSPQKWTWMDNTPFDFEDWDKGQPEDTSGSDCGAVLMQGGRWRAVDCFLQKPYVCTISALDAPSTIGLTTTTTVSPTTTSSTSMVPSTKRTTTSKPKSCPVSWTYYDTTGFCYVVLQGETWINAENRCQFENGHLASIHNLDEDLFLAHIAGGSYAWIGLFTDDNNAHWKWTEGTPFNYTNWRAGEPNNPGAENYVVIYSDATLNNWDGNHASSFICKRLPS